MATLLIDQVAERLHEFRMHAKRERGPIHEPKISVYMEYNFWMRCMRELDGGMSGPAYEFLNSAYWIDKPKSKQTLLGFPVYKVDDAPHHPDYVFHCEK